MLIGAIEAGGTKFVCGIGDENGCIYDKIIFPTTTPDEVLDKIVTYFSEENIKAIGVGTFGPLDLNVNSPTYGYITSTPKYFWQDTNIVGMLKEHFSMPIGFDTDVNAAALGEQTWGAATGIDSCIYMTVGTGIGVGAIVNGELLHGLIHPDMGHVFIKRHPDDLFPGVCPFHKDCLEGLASGQAIEQRWMKKGQELTAKEEVWELEAYYLAQGIANFILTLSPKKVIVGGGVASQQKLLPLIRKNVQNLLNGYVKHELILKNIREYIATPKLGSDAGICGSLVLARTAFFHAEK
ncbi:fructokinase [Scopulibacillus darangshiensis]|uniref:fructokinase n=1 Tax=Scopulibacillus darangshiensis TaxID=442528 RepID=A0A4R2PA80_9BACL|nr:ROK family protein [Scopulibacillus darangshiensis]TCP30991.1 fructokinase [Scopulibacillus darangshiensis]